MMFGDFGETGGTGWPGQRRDSGDDILTATESRLLWALRRMALLQPIGRARCHAVHIALGQDFGEAGMGIEHLLRCWLVGLSRCAVRCVVFGEPANPMVLPDEARLLRALRLAGNADAAIAMLAPMTGAAGAAGLLPLLVAISVLTENSEGRGLSKHVEDISWRT